MSKTFQSITNVGDSFVNSTCVQLMNTNVLRGTVDVLFNDDSIYHYSNVSRRDIFKFQLDKSRSLGKFVNNVLTQSRVKTKQIQTKNGVSTDYDLNPMVDSQGYLY